MSTQLPGFSLQVTIQIKPEDVNKFLDEFKTVFELVTAERQCVFFEVYQSPETPGTISWVEHWSESSQWFFEHQLTKPYYKPYLETTEPMFVAPRQVKILNRLPLQYSAKPPV